MSTTDPKRRAKAGVDVLAEAQLVLARAIELQAEALKALADDARSRRTAGYVNPAETLYPARVTVVNGELDFFSEGHHYPADKVLEVTDVLQLEFRLSDGPVNATDEHKLLIQKLAKFSETYAASRAWLACKISCCRGG